MSVNTMSASQQMDAEAETVHRHVSHGTKQTKTMKDYKTEFKKNRRAQGIRKTVLKHEGGNLLITRVYSLHQLFNTNIVQLVLRTSREINADITNGYTHHYFLLIKLSLVLHDFILYKKNSGIRLILHFLNRYCSPFVICFKII